MKTYQLTNIRMHDGSRQFLALPEIRSFLRVFLHIFRLFGAIPYGYLTDPIECWIDFYYKGHRFTINNQYGEYWFFVNDPKCPDAILNKVSSHFGKLLDDEAPL